MFTGVSDHSRLVVGANLLELEFDQASDACFEFNGSNRHPYNRIFAVVSTRGTPSSIANKTLGKKFVMQAGMIYFMTAGSKLDFEFHHGTCFYAFHFRLTACGRDVFTGLDMLEAAPDSGGMIDAVTRIFQRHPDAAAICVLKSLILQETVRFLPLDRELLPKLEKYRTVLEYIRTQATAKTGIAELAQVQKCSPDVFSRTFSRELGLPAKQYLNRELALRAGRLLRGTHLRIKEIAQQLGFSDVYYFSRFFHKETGLTPSRFRSGILEENMGNH